MATKADFTQEQWETLRDTPHLVALAVAVAGASGIFGSLKEAVASATTIVSAVQGDNALLRALCDKEELKQAQSTIKAQIPKTDMAELQAHLKQAALDNANTAMALLKERGNTTDIDAYGTFLQQIGLKVAEAAKEGGFLGFGGERISSGEKDMLTNLDSVLNKVV